MEEVLSKKDEDIFEHEFAKRNSLEDLSVIMSGESKKDIVQELYSPEGKKWYIAEKEPHIDENNDIIGVIVIYIEIYNPDNTDNKLISRFDHALTILDEKMQSAEKYKNEIIANMSHEIKTPLSIIIGFSELLNMEDITDEQKEYVDYIFNSSHQLNNLINDIIQISSIKSGDIEIKYDDFCLSDLVREIFMYYRTEIAMKNISYELNFNNVEVINSDGNKIKQVLVNLIDNAIKFSHEGTIVFDIKKKSKFIEISITDSGIGIDKQYHEKIFNDFFTIENGLLKKYPGTGLGLFVARAFINYLGGKISVQSTPNKGSKFTFTLPIQK